MNSRVDSKPFLKVPIDKQCKKWSMMMKWRKEECLSLSFSASHHPYWVFFPFLISLSLSNERNNYLSFFSVSSSSSPLLLSSFSSSKSFLPSTSLPFPIEPLHWYHFLSSLRKSIPLSQVTCSKTTSFSITTSILSSTLIAAFVFKNNTQTFYFQLNFFNQFFSFYR